MARRNVDSVLSGLEAWPMPNGKKSPDLSYPLELPKNIASPMEAIATATMRVKSIISALINQIRVSLSIGVVGTGFAQYPSPPFFWFSFSFSKVSGQNSMTDLEALAIFEAAACWSVRSATSTRRK